MAYQTPKQKAEAGTLPAVVAKPKRNTPVRQPKSDSVLLAEAGYVVPTISRHARYIAGIDPDIDKSGLVIYDRQENAWLCTTATLHMLIQGITQDFVPDSIDFIVEAGWDNKGFFHFGGFPPGFDKWGQKSQFAYIAKVGSRVGENFGIGKTIVHMLQAMGYRVHTVKPQSGKWDADEFMQKTGLTYGYNPEVRDACRTMYPFK
ncbi:hypothetical protein [Fibrivirga algicola]|uniref:Uncharacterized protein n=1 Tax=Fibrivirga algicola TaxID=2950420 RepID=A0ABX0QEE2_9BACT|nr:hypothetical protein [Fibrivirga algicola]NID09347.1 hypothetical protein [Fibrivirga algicola]